MKTLKLKADFFNRDTLIVAKELLGKYLVRKIGNKIFEGKIIETEAYCGPKDLACHASKGRTARTEVMFGPAGRAYIYLIYGVYHCLNIVTEQEGYPSAVLIRALDIEEARGPGKLCRLFKIDKNLNREDMTRSERIWIEDRGEIARPGEIIRTPRVGVDYAKEYKIKLWRFLMEKR